MLYRKAEATVILFNGADVVTYSYGEFQGTDSVDDVLARLIEELGSESAARDKLCELIGSNAIRGGDGFAVQWAIRNGATLDTAHEHVDQIHAFCGGGLFSLYSNEEEDDSFDSEW